MGSLGRDSAQETGIGRMVGGTSSGHWKRPINRMYSYNYQVGENYYLPMTSYLSSKSESGSPLDLPGPLCFSERIAVHPIVGEKIAESSSSHLATTTSSSSTFKSQFSSTISSGGL